MEVYLHLRPIERFDLDFLCDLGNDSFVRDNVVGWGWPLSLASQETWFTSIINGDHSSRRFIIDVNGTAVGLIGLWNLNWHDRSAEVGLKIGGKTQEVRGQGYGSRALSQLVNFSFFDVGLHKLWAHVIETNDRSQNLFNNHGWTREGILRNHVWRNGKFVNVVQYGLLYDEITHTDKNE
jgi:RimJ/RimL family protein N-acetyltransferase